MQEGEAHRNSFEESYRVNASQGQSSAEGKGLTASICKYHDSGKATDVEDCRLSEGKQKMLQTFKSTILEEVSAVYGKIASSALENFQNQDGNRLSAPCSQIQEESNESEGKTMKLSLTPKSNENQARESPRFTRGSSLQANHHTTFPQKNTCPNIQISAHSLETQLQHLAERINSSIKSLCKGILLQKYCYHRFKIETVVLSFSEDFEFMSLFIVEKSQMKIYPMDTFIEVQRGLKTRRWKEYLTDDYHIKGELCFSLRFKDRTFDFTVESTERRDKIVEEIELLNESR